MLVFQWFTLLPVDFFNVIVHTTLAFVCISLSLAVSVLMCARGGGKKTVPDPDPSPPAIVSNSEATSKKTTRGEPNSPCNSSTTPQKKDKDKPKPPPQPVPEGPKVAFNNMEEERGERKQKHRHKEDGANKGPDNEDKGSVRISIHGAEANSSDGADDEIYMQDVFDDMTARDDLLPGEDFGRKKKTKRRKPSAGSALQPTQHESYRVDNTQMTSEKQTTVDATNEVTKETNISVTDQTRDTTKADASCSDRPVAKPKPMKIPRQSGSRNKPSGGGHQRKKKSNFKIDPSQTGQTETETSIKKSPRVRKTGSACAQKAATPRIPDVLISTTHKDQSSARS